MYIEALRLENSEGTKGKSDPRAHQWFHREENKLGEISVLHPSNILPQS